MKPSPPSSLLQSVLTDFLARTPDAQFVVAATPEGLLVGEAHTGTPPAHADVLAATAARSLALAQTVNAELHQNGNGRVIIEGEHITTIVGKASNSIILIAAVSSAAKVGVAMFTFKLAANAISQLYN